MSDFPVIDGSLISIYWDDFTQDKVTKRFSNNPAGQTTPGTKLQESRLNSYACMYVCTCD